VPDDGSIQISAIGRAVARLQGLAGSRAIVAPYSEIDVVRNAHNMAVDEHHLHAAGMGAAKAELQCLTLRRVGASAHGLIHIGRTLEIDPDAGRAEELGQINEWRGVDIVTAAEPVVLAVARLWLSVGALDFFGIGVVQCLAHHHRLRCSIEYFAQRDSTVTDVFVLVDTDQYPIDSFVAGIHGRIFLNSHPPDRMLARLKSTDHSQIRRWHAFHHPVLVVR
jgi:hypothetical protein